MRYVAKVIWYGGTSRRKNTAIDYGFAALHDGEEIFISKNNLYLKHRPYYIGLREDEYITLEVKSDRQGRTYGANVRLLEDDTQYFQDLTKLSLSELDEFFTKNWPMHRYGPVDVIPYLLQNPLITDAVIDYEGLTLIPEEAAYRQRAVALLLKHLDPRNYKIKCTQVRTGKSIVLTLISPPIGFLIWSKLSCYLRDYFKAKSNLEIMDENLYRFEYLGEGKAPYLWEDKQIFYLRARAKQALWNQDYVNANKLIREAGLSFSGHDTLRKSIENQIKKAEENNDFSALPGLHIELLSVSGLVNEEPLFVYQFYKPLITAYRQAGDLQAAKKLEEFANPPFGTRISLEDLFLIRYNPRGLEGKDTFLSEMNSGEKVALVKKLCHEEGLVDFQPKDVTSNYELVVRVAGFFERHGEISEAIRYYKKLVEYYEERLPFREKDYLEAKSSSYPLIERSQQFQNYVGLKDRINALLKML